MSCSKFETDIALYAGGDLPVARIAGVETHLAECADCRALAVDLRDSQSLLGSLRDDPIADALAAAVHHRVMAQLGSAGFSRRRKAVPLLALAAALILAAVLAWPRHQTKHIPMAAVQPVRLTPTAPVPLPPSIVRVRHRIIRRRRPALPAQPGPPLLVQFVTDNPNIVIYWLVDQKPQGD